ncbi:PA2169 family four-helix-bundle protein [Dehalobacter sp. DCM]|uniref:DUF2383 domain-containing protein n=1 Tax=Dehalobacter sp. DCM TaxID=2907827 RepID=UPI00308186CE|nr:PA2169 family four-helix-bundle protein [Dehalobacter sp. DCM]
MEHQSQIDTLNELLKGEHMAIHIYDKTKEIQQDEQVAHMLSQFEQDHQRHAHQLSQRIIDLGGKPKANTGLEGIMADINSIFNSYRGPEELLTQIYNGEDKGIHAYEDRIDEIDPTSQEIIRQIMGEDHEHLKWFKARMEKEKSEQLSN